MSDVQETSDTGGGSPAAASTTIGLDFPHRPVLRGALRPDLLRDELLGEIFADSVRAFPDSVCMVSGDLRLTYAQVDAQASAIARGLLRHHVRPGSVVGLWMPRGHDLLIAQIAIAKTGAAWLPFDSDVPVERVVECLVDCDARALLVGPDHFAKASGVTTCPVLQAQTLGDQADQTPLDPRALGATPDHPAYMIYTSGSTGKPKGIVISGRNICHYLRSANEVYGLTGEDVVFQGASVAFDLSMEEIWVPYLVGASLFVATPAIMGDADKLPDVMDEAGVTVLDTVPTLLSMLTRDVPALRVIILGGEACPPSLGVRWCKPGRTIFNSYGPTEATVVATVAQVRIGEPVTIGKPIPNYTCYVVDDALNLVAPGAEGELLIGGPGVALGYLGRPDLTADKFVPNPFTSEGPDPVLYRSGDAVALDAAGDILFRGRIDDQIKIRGFRVELGEIESRITELGGFAQAAVVMRNDDGMDQLVAFLVPEGAGREDVEPRAMRAKLRDVLPAYMVPARFEIVTELPRLSSGKVNRNELKKAPLTAPAEAAEAQEDPRTPTEAKLLTAAQGVLPPQSIPFDADFFTDLGGHSLLAARFLGAVRQHPELASLTLQDVYGLRTLRAMGAALDGRAVDMGPPRDLAFTPPPFMRRFLCGLAQAAALPIIIGLLTAQWLGVFISYMLLSDPEAGVLQDAAMLVGVYIVINISTIFLTIAVKWAVIGRIKPGRYPLWGVYYFRLWFVQRIGALAHMKWFQGSPILPLYLRAMGAKIGKDVVLGDLDIGAFDLLDVGDGASLGGKIKLSNAHVEGNELVVGWITIGPDAYVGTSCVLEADVVIGAGAELKDLTSVPAGVAVPAGEIWDGSPGKKVGMVDTAELPEQSDASPLTRRLQLAVYSLMLLLIPGLGLLPIFPAFWLFDRVDEAIGAVDRTYYLMSLPLMAWPMAFALVLFTVGFIAVIRWTVLPRVREGVYSIHSWFYVRKWIVALSTEITLETLSSLYATVYMRNWYRLMGAKIGKDAEISTNLSGRYDLVEIGEKNFIADEVILGDEDIRRGWMSLQQVTTGPRVFVGNDAVVPIGSIIPAGALIGIKSKPPKNADLSPGDTWFGSPPIKLPVRQKFDALGANWTYEPPPWKKYMRAAFEAVHISLPTMLFVTCGTLAVELIGPPLLAGRYGAALGWFLFLSLVISLFMTFVVIGVKWATMGRYEPVVKPMWSWWAMRTEAVAVLYWGLAGKVLLDHLRGTPFLPWILRLFGTKTGRGVWMDSTDITEFDCVTIGDYCAINSLSALQTHLYEDRVMKVGRVRLGEGVTVGAGSTVLYDSVVGDWARLGPLTVVMKGEAIPTNTEWIGAPAEPYLTHHHSREAAPAS
ncbi:MAG: non-ribosomal peptide synthetase [Hyphomicrobiales bacterium]|nr:non-ribosomal peptide synthetase [Hyphomicrobiales bacterium]